MRDRLFFGKNSRTDRIHFSINQKILMLSAAIVASFLILVIILLASMNSYRKQYDEIVGNLVVANDYNLSFKEDMEESLYKLVVGYIEYEHISEDDTLKDPYVLIEELRSEFKKLRDVTMESESRLWLESLLRNIDTLEKRVDDILENIRKGGKYDENIRELDNNIYILTELIQDNIQYYIYYQIRAMEQVTSALNEQNQNFVVVCACLLAALTVTAICAAYLITAGILKPLGSLYSAMEKVSAGDFAVRTDVHSQDELEILSDGFNSMAENMETMIAQIKEDEQKMRHLDLRLLQEQINPHFLYNTLDTIVWLIEGNKMDEAVNMVVTLSSFFRLVLSKGKEVISLGEEESHIRSYLEIQGMRYRDILEYDIRLAPELYACRIPKLTLQPLVENALYHGIKYKRGKGRIQVRGIMRDGELHLTVQDDGIGMEEEELAVLRKEIQRPCSETEKGFGLANVNERLRMYFGPSYGLKIDSHKGRGTCVEIVIPAIREEEPALREGEEIEDDRDKG